MKLSLLYLVNSVVAVIYSVLILIVPTLMLKAHGMAISDSAILMSRFFGSALLGMGITTWLARNAAPSNARSAITLSFFISDIFGFIVSLMAMLTGQMNAMGWLPVVIYVVFAVGFGYFQFVASEE